MKALIILFILLSGLAQFSCHFKKPKTAVQIEKEHADSLFYAHPVYQVFGEPLYNDRQISDAAKLMGFTYESVSGCVIDNEIGQSMFANNEKAEPILVKKIGKNWKELLFKKADSLYAIDVAAIKIAKKNAIVVKTDHLFDNNLRFSVEHLLDKNLQLVHGYEYQLSTDTTVRQYYQKSRVRATINLTKKTIIKIDTTTILTDTITSKY